MSLSRSSSVAGVAETAGGRGDGDIAFPDGLNRDVAVSPDYFLLFAFAVVEADIEAGVVVSVRGQDQRQGPAGLVGAEQVEGQSEGRLDLEMPLLAGVAVQLFGGDAFGVRLVAVQIPLYLAQSQDFLQPGAELALPCLQLLDRLGLKREGAHCRFVEGLVVLLCVHLYDYLLSSVID